MGANLLYHLERVKNTHYTIKMHKTYVHAKKNCNLLGKRGRNNKLTKRDRIECWLKINTRYRRQLNCLNKCQSSITIGFGLTAEITAE